MFGFGTKKAIAKRLFKIKDVIGENFLVAVTAGATGDPLFLSRDLSSEDNAAQFFIHYPKRNVALKLPLTDQDFTHVQPLQDNSWLLIADELKDGAHHNASIYHASGELTSTFTAVDAIEDVQVDLNDNIWICSYDTGSYEDEDKFNSGLVCLDRQGNTIFDFAGPRDEGDLQPVAFDDECNALNVVSGRETWFYYGGENFPLLKMLDRKIEKNWTYVLVNGGEGFAVRSKHILFGPSYKTREHLVLVNLETMKCEELEPADEKKHRIKIDECFGRGSKLFLVDKEYLHVVDMSLLDTSRS
jgi:hypothetical protein